jgi:glycosyltransferase involved in cell wall biosynthesis
MTDSPRVSVVVPAYNSAHWISRTIESILAQTFGSFEAIVIDDGSTDALEDVLQPYLRREPRLRVIRQRNRGLAGARNRGVAEARAPLVAPLDADDLWHPDFLRDTVAALETSPEAPFAFAYSFRMDDQDRLYPFRKPGRPLRHDMIGLIWLNTVGSGSAAVFRKALVDQVGGFDESMGRRGLHGAEDWKLAIQLARLGDPVLVERHLVGYRLLETSMSQANPRRQLDAILAVLDDIRAESPEIEPRHFADGRTMMTAWLLPIFLRRLRFGEFFREFWCAYGRNPLWFRNALLRTSHRYRLEGTFWFLLRPLFGKRLRHLAQEPFDGDYPFAFLADGAAGETVAPKHGVHARS